MTLHRVALAIAFLGCFPAKNRATCTDSLCSNTCSDADDGWCDDGGPGSSFQVCSFGSDCIDCGPRALPPSDNPPAMCPPAAPVPPLAPLPSAACEALIDFVLVIDTSYSVKGVLGDMKNFAVDITRSFHVDDSHARFGLVTFESVSTLVVPLTTSRTAIEFGISQLYLGGSTCLACGFETATQAFEAATPRATSYFFQWHMATLCSFHIVHPAVQKQTAKHTHAVGTSCTKYVCWVSSQIRWI